MTEVVIDLNSIRTENPDITMGDLFKNHIVPALPKARYFDKTESQVIVLPWVDGNYADDYNPCIVLNAKTSDKLASVNQATCNHGIIDKNGNTKTVGFSYYLYYESIGGGYSTLNLNFSKNKLVWREHQNRDTRCHGIITVDNPSGIRLLSMDMVVAKAKAIKTDEDVNIDINIQSQTSGATSLIYAIGGTLYSSKIYSWDLPTVENVVNVYQLNDGIIYSDSLCLAFPYRHTALKNACSFSTTSDNDKISTTWNTNAVTVNGIGFDIKLSSARDFVETSLLYRTDS